MKRDCPLRLKELLEKKSKSKCFNCHQSGHFSNECDLNWVDPLVDEPVVKNVNVNVSEASSFVETIEKINVTVSNGNLDEIVTVKDVSGGDSDVNPRNCVTESSVQYK